MVTPSRLATQYQRQPKKLMSAAAAYTMLRKYSKVEETHLFRRLPNWPPEEANMFCSRQD